ncbi:MAG TPA: hypothetical protein VFN35_07820, partial [Ktedonobacteraceae bacterium]|nr:hypothetical protein [Ktedonobacteraceae bacterium]
MASSENQFLFSNSGESQGWEDSGTNLIAQSNLIGRDPHREHSSVSIEAQQPEEADLSRIEKIVIVTRKTALEDLVVKQNSKAQAQFYLEQNNISYSSYERADSQYQQAFQALRRQIPEKLKVHYLDRDLLPTYQFGEHDLVVTLGQDGLVINVAKYLTTQPILALNPDPSRIDGVLIPFAYTQFRSWLERTLRKEVQIKHVSMAKATLNDGQTLYAVNDLFIGPRTHSSARYILEYAGSREQQSSSGMIVSTGAGCTGWLRSITTGSWRVAQYFGASVGDPPSLDDLALGWDSNRLWFSVREPFVSKTS